MSAFICAIAVIVVATVFSQNSMARPFGQQLESLAIVSMTEPRESTCIEAISVADFAPHVDKSSIRIGPLEGLAPLSHGRARSDNIVPEEIIPYPEHPAFIALVNRFPDKPRNIACWQITDVSKTNVTNDHIAFSQIGIDTEYFGADIGALKDSGVFNLLLSDAREGNGQPSNDASRDSRYQNPVEIKLIKGVPNRAEEYVVTSAILIAIGWVAYLALRWIAR